MITPAQQRLHALWHRPGAVMADGWWQHMSMDAWQQPYAEHAGVRPSLDALIAEQLGHQGAIPPLTPQAQMLLDDEQHSETLCIALGLWALNCPDYLLLRPYRLALAEALGESTLAQLCTLFPANADAPACVEPAQLIDTARTAGGTWLAAADDPAVAATRLLWSPTEAPTQAEAPKASPMPILDKLRKWL
ncbi:hypothetical protein EO087_13205 [Dyella sp. M7H15-1]|uniref:type III secretion system domain-containing protein n=1 Tax=Dyella sp. M7H15-1 TaxID=2501295 RepID=UPI001004DBF7|nr:type III secretion system domain-containing protein [Dyella sp. M7H15-1]QAU24829.1 hypothetical protein EO087_13205 [Dyella sp. M7H15-1]